MNERLESCDPGHDRPAPAADTLPRAAVPLHPRVLVGYGAALGLAMIAAGVVWGLVQGLRLPGAWFPGSRWLAYLLAGGGVGVLFALAAYRLLDAIPALRRIEGLLFATLDMNALRPHHAVLLGLVAGFPEEILFRGAVQPALGLIAASLIFGALHAITPAYFVYAAVAGGLLGALARWSGGLWAPIAAHTAIDLVMFLLLIRRWRRVHGGVPSR